MELHQLEIFLAVIDTASVTKASERVHLSPGAVSLQLRSLAEELNTELFLRCGRNLSPTPAAHRLAEFSRPMLRHMHTIQQAFENSGAGDKRPFHFATGATTLIYRLGKPLRNLRKQYPNTEIHVTVSATEEIVKGLLERRYDLGLISLPVSDEHLRILPLYDEELLLLRSANSRVRDKHVHNIRPEDLARVPFILYPKHSNMRSLIERHLAEVGVTPRVVMEAGDTEAIKGLVQAGFGYSVLPEHAVRTQSRFFQLLRIPNHKLVRQQALAMPHTYYPRKLTDSIAEFLQSSLGGMPQGGSTVHQPAGPVALPKPLASGNMPTAVAAAPPKLMAIGRNGGSAAAGRKVDIGASVGL